MEKLNDKKPLADGKMLDLLTRLIKLRKRSRQTNEKLDELKKQADEFLRPDPKEEGDGPGLDPVQYEEDLELGSRSKDKTEGR